MSAEIHFDFSSIQSILIIGLIILVGAYLYYEIHKIKVQINKIDQELTHIHTSKLTGPQANQLINPTEVLSDGHIVNQVFEESPIDQSIPPDINTGGDEWNAIHHLMNNFETENNTDNPSDIAGGSPDLKNEITDSPDLPDLPDLPDETIDLPDDVIDLPVSDVATEPRTIMDDLNQNVNEEIDDIMDDIMNQHDTKIIEPDYSKMTVSELKKILTDKNLTVSGNKTKLIERIKENP